MAEQDLDSIVKGAPAPGRDVKPVGGPSPVLSSADGSPLPGRPGDPLSHAPSSPSMIYLNMLVLEASLRAQFLELRARRRHHTFFLLLLASWILGFGYALFLAPREDGRGVGGSIYWGVEVAEKVCLMGGIITAVLVWATGIWDRGIRWPRRWLAVSNRGLRGFNCKLVLVPRPWWAEMLSTIGFFLTYGMFHHNASSSYRAVDPAISRAVENDMGAAAPDGHPILPIVAEDEENAIHEEDLAPGGDYVKLLLLPKTFSATFRENWEIYRSEYWERENERRSLLRARIKERDKQLAQSQSAWLWWLRLWVPWRRSPSEEILHAANTMMMEKPVHAQHLQVARERKRRNSSVRRGSTSSSRSQTPSMLEPDDFALGRKVSPGGGGSVGPDRRRKKTPSVSLSGKAARRPFPESRSVTPDVPSPLGREARDVSPTPVPAEGRILRSSVAGARAASLSVGSGVERERQRGASTNNGSPGVPNLTP